MKSKKEVEDNYKKITKFILTFLGGFVQKISVGLVLNAKKQVDEIISQVKRGVLAGFFLLLGLFFVLIGLSIYLGSIFEVVSGSGYFVVGSVSLLIAFLVILIKK